MRKEGEPSNGLWHRESKTRFLVVIVAYISKAKSIFLAFLCLFFVRMGGEKIGMIGEGMRGDFCASNIL